MTKEIKIESEELLEAWEVCADARYKAIQLKNEAEMYAAMSQHYKTVFWDMVHKEHGINVRCGSWTYDEETKTVSRQEEHEHPLARMFGGMTGISVEHVNDDKSGTVI